MSGHLFLSENPFNYLYSVLERLRFIKRNILIEPKSCSFILLNLFDKHSICLQLYTDENLILSKVEKDLKHILRKLCNRLTEVIFISEDLKEQIEKYNLINYKAYTEFIDGLQNIAEISIELRKIIYPNLKNECYSKYS